MSREELIARYRSGYDEVVSALVGITKDELDRKPSPADWSPRQIVHHLADSEMTGAIRLRRLLAEDSPHIQGYDEGEFARTLYYERPIEASLAAFKAARESTVPILERMSDDQWKRSGKHSEHGDYSAEFWLELTAAHAHDHADQIRAARGSS